jgi:glycosyltransferase involved in cell wall biosynthesis
MKQKPSSRIRVSVIVSAVDIEDQAEGMIRAIAAAFEPLKKPFEMIVVDDGSRDGTFLSLSALARADKRLRIIRLRTTFG